MKNITLEKLADMIKTGFSHSENKTDEKLESLARSINKGFREVDEKFIQVEGRFTKVDERFDSFEKSIKDRLFETNDLVFGLQDKMARVERILRIG